MLINEMFHIYTELPSNQTSPHVIGQYFEFDLSPKKERWEP